MEHITSEKTKASRGSWEVELFNRWKTQTILRRKAEMLRSQPRTLEKEGWAAQGSNNEVGTEGYKWELCEDCASQVTVVEVTL